MFAPDASATSLCVASLVSHTNQLSQADDELDLPVLAGFEWDPEECYTRFVVHQKKEGAANTAPSKKKKKNQDE
jgi:hypothetical protein